MAKKEKWRTIAHSTAGTPPATVKTLKDWLAWRAEEDLRMAREMKEQREAFFERLLNDPTEH